MYIQLTDKMLNASLVFAKYDKISHHQLLHEVMELDVCTYIKEHHAYYIILTCIYMKCV